MKIKHVVLFGVVTSILSYLNTVMEEDKDERQDEILDELKTLIADENINKEAMDTDAQCDIETEASNDVLISDITDDIIDELDSIIDSLAINDDIQEIDEEVEEHDGCCCLDTCECSCHDEECDHECQETCSCDDETCDECCCEDEQTCECSNETQEQLTDEVDSENAALIAELEELLSSIDAEKEIDEKDIADFSEEEYLQQIKEAIDNSVIVDQNGENVDLNSVVDEMMDEKSLSKEIEKNEIDDIFSEILEQEGITDDEVEQTDEDEYIDDLVEELNATLDQSQEDITNDDEEIDIYAQINELYPYLSLGFVRAVYDLKEAIANEYPIDQKMIILHRLSFKYVEDLRQFVEIVMNHDYRVNVDEKQMIVDIFKEFQNADGKILTNIFEIANQAKLLHGEYEGYRIEF